MSTAEITNILLASGDGDMAANMKKCVNIWPDMTLLGCYGLQLLSSKEPQMTTKTFKIKECLETFKIDLGKKITEFLKIIKHTLGLH